MQRTTENMISLVKQGPNHILLMLYIREFMSMGNCMEGNTQTLNTACLGGNGGDGKEEKG